MKRAERLKKVIAIDGPAGAGKSTVARRVAKELGFVYIDTGAMYRAATWLVLEKNINTSDLEAIVHLVADTKIELIPEKDSGAQKVLVNGQDVTTAIRSQTVTRLVSPVSAIAGVRHCLAQKQQNLAAGGGVVMDGRDIGTVVLPNADLKIFLTASPGVRAKRRLHDLEAMGEHAELQVLLKEIQQRDRLDSSRSVAPLKQAQDAVLINTDSLSVDQVVDKILNLCHRFSG